MTGVELTQEEREAVDRMSRVFGWQHLARYSGKSSEWLSLTLGAMARAALHAAESEVARLTRERDEAEAREQDAAWARTRAFNTLDRLTAVVEAVEALLSKWQSERSKYPTVTDPRAEGAYHAVRLCEDELRAALASAASEDGAGDE